MFRVEPVEPGGISGGGLPEFVPDPRDSTMSDSDSLDADDEGVFLDDDAVLEPGAESEAEPDDPWTRDVFAQLDKLQNSQRSWIQTLLILVVTLVLFGAAQFVQKSAENLVCLVLVLLVHETGHFAGMKLFGYRDVRMFFLPFFGAAVSGRSHNVPGWQEGIVILLGPLPGIVIGAVLGILAWALEQESLRPMALLFITLNGFNLLPFMPLDGGRLLQLVLFGRQRHLQALFQATTGILMALGGAMGGGWGLGAVGFFMLITSGHVFRVNTVARQTLAELGDGAKATDDLGHVPRGIALQIVDRVRDKFPQAKNTKVVASLIQQIWERMQVNPPDVVATLALLAVYGLSVVGTLVIAVGLVLGGTKNRHHVAPPSRDRQMLAQPQLEFADGSVTHQGTAFFVHALNGATAAVTASHYLDQDGPALTHIRFLSVTTPEPQPLADSAVCWGLPGGKGVRGANEVTDLREDRFLLPVQVDEQKVHVLDLDDRASPLFRERVWFPDKQPGEPGGFRLIEGTVIQVETRFVCVRLDDALKLQSQSGSPVISQVNGKVLGLWGGASVEPARTLLFLNPVGEIRKALEVASRPQLSTVVGKSPRREQPVLDPQ